MELGIWVDDGVQRFVSGITDATTCQDIIYALAHAVGRTGRFALIEKWRTSERSLSPQDQPLKILKKWGEYANDVQFFLRHLDLEVCSSLPEPCSTMMNGISINGERIYDKHSRRSTNNNPTFDQCSSSVSSTMPVSNVTSPSAKPYNSSSVAHRQQHLFRTGPSTDHMYSSVMKKRRPDPPSYAHVMQLRTVGASRGQNSPIDNIPRSKSVDDLMKIVKTQDTFIWGQQQRLDMLDYELQQYEAREAQALDEINLFNCEIKALESRERTIQDAVRSHGDVATMQIVLQKLKATVDAKRQIGADCKRRLVDLNVEISAQNARIKCLTRELRAAATVLPNSVVETSAISSEDSSLSCVDENSTSHFLRSPTEKKLEEAKEKIRKIDAIITQKREKLAELKADSNFMEVESFNCISDQPEMQQCLDSDPMSSDEAKTKIDEQKSGKTVWV